MNWKTLFKPADILTAADRAELEKIDQKAKLHRDLIERIREEWPSAADRIGVLERLAHKLAADPKDEKIFQRATITACMPENPAFGNQHRDSVTGILGRKIEQILEPQARIVRRVFGRALEGAESELQKTEAAERGAAKEEGYEYSPSGRVLALQKRVLELRNHVAAPYPGEENCINHPGTWQERLQEWL
jgi:hypothetical protein